MLSLQHGAEVWKTHSMMAELLVVSVSKHHGLCKDVTARQCSTAFPMTTAKHTGAFFCFGEQMQETKVFRNLSTLLQLEHSQMLFPASFALEKIADLEKVEELGKEPGAGWRGLNTQWDVFE